MDIINPNHKFQDILIQKHPSGYLLSTQYVKQEHFLLLKKGYWSCLKSCLESKKYETAGLQLVDKCKGLIGLIRFLEGFYLIYIKQRKEVCVIGQKIIYEIKDVGILPIFEKVGKYNKRQNFFQQKIRQYNFQNCYFSYNYNITRPVSYNITKDIILKKQINNIKLSKQQPLLDYDDRFLWNFRLISQAISIINPQWMIPIIHGYISQLTFIIKQYHISLILLARRSRHQAGTRYLKRGLNGQGFVANQVETQQILINRQGKGCASSYIQYRGSAPVYWFQRPSILIPKPPIQFYHEDLYYLATRKHFRDLTCVYGKHILAVNLMKQNQHSPRQSLLTEHYQSAFNYLNKRIKGQVDIEYYSIDMKAQLKQSRQNFVKQAKKIAKDHLKKANIFIVKSDSNGIVEIVYQNGIIRSNCVDCLDRTNSFQQIIGQAVLIVQLQQLTGETIDDHPSFLREFRKCYEEMGDLISIQYGSSLAHKQKVDETKPSKFQFLTSLKRHFNNNITDYDRQLIIDIFLKNTQGEIEGVQPQKYCITHVPERKFLLNFLNNWQQNSLKSYENFIGLTELKEQAQKINENKFKLMVISNKLTKWLAADGKQYPKYIQNYSRKQSSINPINQVYIQPQHKKQIHHDIYSLLAAQAIQLLHSQNHLPYQQQNQQQSALANPITLQQQINMIKSFSKHGCYIFYQKQQKISQPLIQQQNLSQAKQQNKRPTLLTLLQKKFIFGKKII